MWPTSSPPRTPTRSPTCWREDVVGPTLDRDEVLAQAPVSAQGRFGVPAILGEEP